MLLGRVIGTVVATRKDVHLTGLRLLLVEEVNPGLEGTGRHLVAADAVGAGPGEIVLFATGSSARLTEATLERPVDAVISAIIDEVDEAGTLLYSKSSEPRVPGR